MPITYRQRCMRCKQDYVLVSGRQKYPLCYNCQKQELHQKIKNPKMKKLFDIPEEYYKENIFLRSIKLYYLKFGELSEKQIEAFKKTVEKFKKS